MNERKCSKCGNSYSSGVTHCLLCGFELSDYVVPEVVEPKRRRKKAMDVPSVPVVEEEIEEEIAPENTDGQEEIKEEIVLSPSDTDGQEESAEAKYKKDRIADTERMPPHYKVLFGRKGDDLAEVARINPREKVLFSTQTMLEELANPKRTMRASRVFREAYLHYSIAEGGEGRDDIKVIGEQIAKQESAQKGTAFG